MTNRPDQAEEEEEDIEVLAQRHSDATRLSMWLITGPSGVQKYTIFNPVTREAQTLKAAGFTYGKRIDPNLKKENDGRPQETT